MDFVKRIDDRYTPENNVYNSTFDQYERVVIESLITSFGLDFLVRDQHGGDVDTIHNVRQIGKDKQMTYKSRSNQQAYEYRGEYNHGTYHASGNFQDKKHKARESFQETGQLIRDEYTGREIGFFSRHTNAIPPSKKAELDHIISTKEIHDDRGRVLSSLNGISLANSDDNLAWTNKALNSSKGAKDMEAYTSSESIDGLVSKYTELGDADTIRRQMREKDCTARRGYDGKINRAYYTSPAFFRDTAKAAGKVGIAMGLRQALGLVFSEIWFAVRDKIKQGKEDGKALFNSIAAGVKQGLENARNKYKELWHRFIEGSVGGVLASLTTTLCNIFFTTAKSLVRIIRQSWASLVEAAKILIFNPDLLPFGERFRAAAKIVATGASVVTGLMVGDLIAKTGVGAIPVVGEIVQTFCGTLVTGIMSCSLLYLLDRNSTINKIVQVLNSIPTVEDIVVYHRMQAELLEEYCAKLKQIDLAKFKKETQSYNEASILLESVHSQSELNLVLRRVSKSLNISIPLDGHKDLDSFMQDTQSRLRFS